MRTPVEVLQETASLLYNVDINLRCFSGMHNENSPDYLITEILLEEVDNLQDLVSRLICHYNAKN